MQIFKKFKQIYEGWRNDLFPPEELKEVIKQTQDERISICTNCDLNSTKGEINKTSYCKDCGCPLKKKTACLSCNCPKEYWTEVMSSDEDKDLQKKIKYK